MVWRTFTVRMAQDSDTLADRGLIPTESTMVITKKGLRRSDSLCCTIPPFQEMLESHSQGQLRSLEVQIF